ncbi:phage antirepressor protein KilAC domain protein [Oxobacter pfennigii]|uniref:Phage antirepressor protein KilAC domain protein n=1 Tax=Oxobacter pfennigii TaxID=36849 RepID=A0A0P8YBP3_9CLOT|nr:phage antirepressor KilAC domain-containing protein [Oxobacter pfennigii]KPU44495.1 phage antirepressor protein KilAC domain protein [Oxobacter pfennigii]
MNELTTFNYEGKEVRTVQRNGETWWVAKDVCDVFGETNRNRAMKSLDEDEKGYTQMNTPGGIQQTAVVNEPGLYSLLLAMRPAKARGISNEYIFQREQKLKEFKRWVTHEALPSIRKHGLYATDELLANPDLWIRTLQELKAERSKNAALEATISLQEQQIAEMKPKASYYDVVLNCKDAVAITTIAKDYGRSGRWLNEYLHDAGVQFRQGKIWLLYQKHARHGYAVTRTHIYPEIDGMIHSKVHTYWTQKGRLFIYELLKSHGVLPLIEQEPGFEFK